MDFTYYYIRGTPPAPPTYARRKLVILILINMSTYVIHVIEICAGMYTCVIFLVAI